MSYNLLEKYHDLITQNEHVILEDWIDSTDVKDIFIEHAIDGEFFKENFAKKNICILYGSY